MESPLTHVTKRWPGSIHHRHSRAAARRDRWSAWNLGTASVVGRGGTTITFADEMGRCTTFSGRYDKDSGAAGVTLKPANMHCMLRRWAILSGHQSQSPSSTVPCHMKIMLSTCCYEPPPGEPPILTRPDTYKSESRAVSRCVALKCGTRHRWAKVSVTSSREFRARSSSTVAASSLTQ
jgi:hypothetical protein